MSFRGPRSGTSTFTSEVPKIPVTQLSLVKCDLPTKISENSIYFQGATPPEPVCESLQKNGSEDKINIRVSTKVTSLVNDGWNTHPCNPSINAQLGHILKSKKKLKRLPPRSKTPSRKKVTPSDAQDSTATMTKSNVSLRKNKNAATKTGDNNQTELLKTIENLKLTVENLSKQLEEERAQNAARALENAMASTRTQAEASSRHPRTEEESHPLPLRNNEPETEVHEAWTEITPSKRPRTDTPPRYSAINLPTPDLAGPSNNEHRTASPNTPQQMEYALLQSRSNQQKSPHPPTGTQHHSNNSFAKSSLVKPLIINIMESSQQTSYRIVKESLGINNFRIKRINNTRHYIQLENLTDHMAVLDILSQRKIKYFSFTPKSRKPQTLLLKGLDNSFSPEEILAELKDLNLPNTNILKVSNFATTNSIKNNVVLPFFLIQISPESDLNTLTKIKSLLHQTITWDKIIKKDPIMCSRCQRTGHSASNCHLDYRCVKCAENHEPGNCKIKKDEKVIPSKLFCVRCKDFGHPASYKGCPQYKEIKARLLNIAVQKTEHKITSLDRIRNNLNIHNMRTNVPYAQMVKKKTNSSHTQVNANRSSHTNQNSPIQRHRSQHTISSSSTSTPSPTPFTPTITPHSHIYAQTHPPQLVEDLFADFKNLIIQHMSRLENLITHNSQNIQQLHDIYFGFNSDPIETNPNDSPIPKPTNE